jgi:hypothetical protein
MKKKTEEINPFLDNLEIACNFRSSYNKSPTGHSYNISHKLFDSGHYTEVYHESLLSMMLLLNGSSPTLVVYIITKLGYGSEKIELNPDKVCDLCKFSYATYKRALEQLKDLSIIVKSNRRNTYWINPNLFFRGSRMKAFPDNLKIPELPNMTKPITTENNQ